MSFSREETLKKVLKIIADKLNMSPENVTPTSSFKDLGADSLDIVEMVMSFEETFGIEIKDEDAEKIKSVQEAVNLIHKSRTK
jgi:acyl carrier protein